MGFSFWEAITNTLDFTQLSVLITGGTGSFGQAFTRRLLALGCPRIAIFSRDEAKQAAMAQNLSPYANRLRFFIGDVRDAKRLKVAMHGIDIVAHAAALKRIDAAEYNPTEVVYTNVYGSQNVIDAALECGVWRIIGLSSDKACNPVTLYGRTKALMESMFCRANVYAGSARTRFACTRYGNVLGSRGSVIHLWREQAAQGKPLTITDPASTRFWITLEQGVDLVLTALDTMQGGEVFVPNIPAMMVSDLADAIAPDCPHEYIGLRSTEKADETMIANDEARQTRYFGNQDRVTHYVILPTDPSWPTDFVGVGQPVGSDFEYRSDTIPWRLSRAEMQMMLEQVP